MEVETVTTWHDEAYGLLPEKSTQENAPGFRTLLRSEVDMDFTPGAGRNQSATSGPASPT